MKKYSRYLLGIIIIICSIGTFSVISGRTRSFISNNNPDIIEIPQDTAPRFPVKKTQPITQNDINKKSPIDLNDPTNIKTDVEYDLNTGYYIFRTKVGDQEIITPISMTRDEYMNYSLKRSMVDYFRKKNLEKEDGDKNIGDYLFKNVDVSTSSLDRIFGPGGVKFNINGYIEASMSVKNTYTNNPSISQGNRGKTSFVFDENIQVNANASVGNKINFGMNYDTESMFDFDSKKIKLGYSGDEDEILKRIEAGNVSMTTSNSLINGGTALFGITAEMQFGKLRVNTVLSQQESESRTINTQGSVQKQEFEFMAGKYEENRHFFLAQYFRDNYETGMSKLPYVKSAVNITRIEVWVTNVKTVYGQARNIVAFADLAERNKINNTGKWIGAGNPNPSNAANNLYSTVNSTYAAIRDIKQVTSTFEGVLKSGLDYEKVESARLLSSSEYSFNAQLGYISLTSSLQSSEVLAVAYEYTMGGKTYKVGEFAQDITAQYDASNAKSGSLILRLLKPVSLTPTPYVYTWNLMMKNVYSLGATGIQADGFKLNISYRSDSLGTYITYLPDGDIKNQRLLNVMGLDRLNANNSATPNDAGNGVFDFVEGYTINASTGRIYFPVVEPFGSHLKKKINNPSVDDKYVYQELYDSTLTVAQQTSEKNKYLISGSYKGSVSTTSSTSNSFGRTYTATSEISLNATNVPQGSVTLTAAGSRLTEGVDYSVDYIAGTVTILNENLIESSTPIEVSLEDRTFSMQRKTLMGVNLDYDISKKLRVGTTVMHYYEKPLSTKTEIGSEAVKNTMWGVNFSYNTQSQWLTNMLNKLPFVEASQPSQISLNGEYANLIAGHYKGSENSGYSYLDDFESSQSAIDLKNPYTWSLASTPSMFEESKLSNDIKYGQNRSLLSWFSIDPLFTNRNSTLTPQHIKNDKNQLSNHFVREVYVREIYPDRKISSTETGTTTVLNLSYYPTERGPYNLDATNIDRNGALLNPKKRWGGIMRKLDVSDFESYNVEYVEFWLMDPFVYNDTATVKNTGGKLYINLGNVSEDVLKDGRKFYENGLPTSNDLTTTTETTVWGKVPTKQSTVYAFDNQLSNEDKARQDVGLNGLSSAEEMEFSTYSNYVTAYRSKLSPSALEKQLQNKFSPFFDPAGDNYHYFRGSDYDAAETSILDRYKFFNGTEGNSSDNSESYSTISRSIPDVEDIDQDNTMNESESYYQYEIDLKPAQMVVGQNNIVDSQTTEITLRNGQKGNITWYQFKVPIKSPSEKVGGINGYNSIRYIRMFMSDFEQNTFLRFGTLQLVRGEWRTYDKTLNVNNTPSGSNGELDVTTVNLEENGSKTPVNYVLPPGLSRTLDPDQSQLREENEQSLSLKVTNLDPEDARAVYKNTTYDLRRYKRLQMFVHAEKQKDEISLERGELTVFMRLGSDYKNNYYEYEIPLSITPPGTYSNYSESDKYIVWPKGNMFDISLETLKNLKLERNKEKRKAGSPVSYTSLYSKPDPNNQSNQISIIGNPSLGEINVIMIGVRSKARQTKSAEIWVNELRLTDFDENGGWAAQGNATVALSDIGTISVSGRKETAGFGSLDQSLMERRMDDYSMHSISLNLDMGRFLPEKAKIKFPFYYSMSSQTSTPKYDPYNSDVTLNESLSTAINKSERDSIRSIAKEKTTNQSISFTNAKVDIKSKTPMPYDPANLSFSYSHNKTEINNPTTVYDVAKDYKAQVDYNYAPLVKTWEPFKGMKKNTGSAKFLKSLGINYMPSSISFNSTLSRTYVETLTRDLEAYTLGVGASNSQFLSWNQSFYWDRDFNMNWDLTRNLRMSFQSGTRAEIEEPYLQVNKKQNRTDYEIWKDSVWRSIKNLGNPLLYNQMARATYQLPFRSIPAMDWVNSSVNYTSGYQWERGAKVRGEEIGNTVNNNLTIDFTNRLNMTSFYNKFSYLKKINDRFDSRRRQQEQSPAQKERASRRKRFTETITLLPDSAYILTHNLNTKNIDISAKSGGKTYKLKFKKIDNNSIRINSKDSTEIQVSIVEKGDKERPSVFREIGDYSLRGLMSVRSLTVNYSKRKETYIYGFNQGIGDALGQKNTEYGLSPGLGFAFGFDGGMDFIDKADDRNWLIKNTENITPAIFNDISKLELRSQLEPVKGLKIELNASRETNSRTEVQYMYTNMPRIYSGSFSMTTIGLSSALRSLNASNGYQSDAFDKFRVNRSIIKDRLENKYNQTNYPNSGFIADLVGFGGNSYDPTKGNVPINSGDVLIPAFIAAYTGRDVNTISLTAFPSLASLLPNWNLSYDGLVSIPFLKDNFKSFRLTHGYTCFYQVNSYESYSDWVDAGGGLGYTADVLSGNPIPSSAYSIAAVTLSELFNPLFGIEGVLNSSMSVNTQYNTGRVLNLNMTSYQIVEAIQKEWVVGVGYRINDFNRIIGIGAGSKGFNNDLNIKADLSHKTNQSLIRKIEENYTQATSGTTIITLRLSADYALSRSLNFKAFIDRIVNKPLITTSGYPTTNTEYGVSVRFSLQP